MSYQNTRPPRNVSRPGFQKNTLPAHGNNYEQNRFPLPNSNQMYHNPILPDQRPPLVENRFPFPTYQRSPFVEPPFTADQRPRFADNIPAPSSDQAPPFVGNNKFHFPIQQRPFVDNHSQRSQGNIFAHQDSNRDFPGNSRKYQEIPGNTKTHSSQGDGLPLDRNNFNTRMSLSGNPPVDEKQNVHNRNRHGVVEMDKTFSGSSRLPVGMFQSENDNGPANNGNQANSFSCFDPGLVSPNTPAFCPPFANILPRPPQPAPPHGRSSIPGGNQPLLNQRFPPRMSNSAVSVRPLNVTGLRFPPPAPTTFVSGPNMATNQTMFPEVALFCRPPLPPAEDPDIYKNMKEEYKDTMSDIVQKWVNSRNLFEPSKLGIEQLKLHKFREELKLFVGLIDKLRHLNDSLAEHMEAEKCVWDELIVNVTKTKREVVTLQCKLFNPEQLNFIMREQKNRKKKRDRIRRKKRVQSEQYISSLSIRIKLNEEIDEAMQKEHTKNAMEKMVESLKNEAGESLVEVKHKQKEVSEYTNILHLLKQLRDMRKKTAIYKGIFVTEKDDEKFAGQMEKVLDLLSCQSKICENEERALRVLREEEAEEMNRVEKEKRKKRKQNRQEQLSTVDPMFPFRLYWLQGEESISGLIHVRRMWDIFLCQPDAPGGTRIPKTFVEPNQTPNREWSKFLVKQAKVRKRKSDIGISK